MNKVVIIDPNNVKKTIPELYNEELEAAIKNDKITYLTFMYADLADKLNDQTEFINNYRLFMEEWDLPYTFFPYYAYFNKIFPSTAAIPNPRLKIKLKTADKYINAVGSPAYGFLIINVKKLNGINFRFNEKYPNLYYLQDLIQKCFENQLWISNVCFIDRFESWKDLKNNDITGFYLDTTKFKEEKTEYDKQQIQYHSINDFINIFKEKYS